MIIKCLLSALIITITFASEAVCANRLFFEDFEDPNDWQQYFTGGGFAEGYTKRVNHQPYAGSWSLRSNLNPTRVDPVTNHVGSNNVQLECRFGGLTQNTPEAVFIRYFLKIDHCNWPNQQAKKEYLPDDTYGLGAWFTGLHFPQTSNMTWSPNGAGGDWEQWCQAHYFPNGILYMNGQTPVSFGPDGQWHKFEFYFDYLNDTFQYWIDGVKIIGVGANSVYADGVFPLHPGYHLRGLQFMYGQAGYNWAGTSDGINPVGYSVGWQLDNLEAWDGLPDDMGGPAATPTSDSIAPGAPGNLRRQSP